MINEYYNCNDVKIANVSESTKVIKLTDNPLIEFVKFFTRFTLNLLLDANNKNMNKSVFDFVMRHLTFALVACKKKNNNGKIEQRKKETGYK